MASRFSVSGTLRRYNGLQNVVRLGLQGRSVFTRAAVVLADEPAVLLKPAGSDVLSCTLTRTVVAATGRTLSTGSSNFAGDTLKPSTSSVEPSGCAGGVVGDRKQVREAGLGWQQRPGLGSRPAGGTTATSSFAMVYPLQRRQASSPWQAQWGDVRHVVEPGAVRTSITSSSSGLRNPNCSLGSLAVTGTCGQKSRALHSSSLSASPSSSGSSSGAGKEKIDDEDDATVTREAETVDEQKKSEENSDYHRNKLVVFGGNGFVGSHICREALSRGIHVTSVNRSGPPARQEPWLKEVEWVRGDVFDPDVWRMQLRDASGVVSCIGGFGTNDEMRRINGHANVKAVQAAAEEDVKRFVLISAHYFSVPAIILRGYYEGKRIAEEAVRSKFPYGGIILRPGFIHGNRNVGNLTVPLSVIGGPLEAVMRSRAFTWTSNLPIVGSVLLPPVKATAVAKAAVRAATDNAIPPGILDVWSINRLAEKA
ncbi:hypothetical protein CBR_g6602 [Chara braunii]|uniref:NAD(P)-binding domain-containing protein n=1 Tax=Chara braunii TaxID=69332 RepID=A0A388KKI2_CHABU|nr:hypothetical protein CBR_g6602 [Chara braunii]|eukprot:GBG70473.1 hypothetical protein CBR_g6602 [Chara braunii]